MWTHPATEKAIILMALTAVYQFELWLQVRYAQQIIITQAGTMKRGLS